MFRRRFRSGGRRPSRPKHWCRKRQTFNLTLAGNQLIDLLQPTDYDGNTSLSPTGVTMARIIVDCCMAWQGDATANDLSAVDWMLWAADSDTANLSVVTANLTDERILASGCMQYVSPAVAGGLKTNGELAYHFHIDTRVKVKLKDHDVRLSFTEAGYDGTAIVCVAHSAILLVGDTT